MCEPRRAHVGDPVDAHLGLPCGLVALHLQQLGHELGEPRAAEAHHSHRAADDMPAQHRHDEGVSKAHVDHHTGGQVVREEAERGGVDDADRLQLEALKDAPLGRIAPLGALALALPRSQAEGFGHDRGKLADVRPAEAQPAKGESVERLLGGLSPRRADLDG